MVSAEMMHNLKINDTAFHYTFEHHEQHLSRLHDCSSKVLNRIRKYFPSASVLVINEALMNIMLMCGQANGQYRENASNRYASTDVVEVSMD